MPNLPMRYLPSISQTNRKRDTPSTDETQGQKIQKDTENFEKALSVVASEDVPVEEPMVVDTPTPPPQPVMDRPPVVPSIPPPQPFQFSPPPLKKRKENDNTQLYAAIGLAIIVSLLTYMFMERIKTTK